MYHLSAENASLEREEKMKMTKSLSKLLLVVFLTVTMLTPCVKQTFAASTGDDNVTLGEIQVVLEQYLNENYPELEIGEEEFFDFVKEQLLGEKIDEALSQKSEYPLIHAYLVEYYNAYSDYKMCKEMLQEDLGRQTKAVIDESQCLVYDDTDKTVEFIITDEFLERSIGEIKAQNEVNDTLPNDKFSIKAAYSSSSAIKYARQYALGWNTVYPKYSSDCTNFVSQCLKAGGVPTKGSRSTKGTYSTTTEWFCKYTTYKPNDQNVYRDHAVSTSWIRAVDFKKYMTSVAKSTKTVTSKSSLLSNCSAGNVVILCDKTTGSPYHCIIISSKTSSKATYCGHTTNRKDANISGLNDTKDKFFILKF